MSLNAQVLCRADLQPEPQILSAFGLEEKDPPSCCCRACLPHGVVYRCPSIVLVLDILVL